MDLYSYKQVLPKFAELLDMQYRKHISLGKFVTAF